MMTHHYIHTIGIVMTFLLHVYGMCVACVWHVCSMCMACVLNVLHEESGKELEKIAPSLSSRLDDLQIPSS